MQKHKICICSLDFPFESWGAYFKKQGLSSFQKFFLRVQLGICYIYFNSLGNWDFIQLCGHHLNCLNSLNSILKEVSHLMDSYKNNQRLKVTQFSFKILVPLFIEFFHLFHVQIKVVDWCLSQLLIVLHSIFLLRTLDKSMTGSCKYFEFFNQLIYQCQLNLHIKVWRISKHLHLNRLGLFQEGIQQTPSQNNLAL